MSGSSPSRRKRISTRSSRKSRNPNRPPTLPKSSLPVAPKPETPVAVVDVPEIPETETPTIPAPSVSVPALDTPLPVSVTNWDQMVARIPVQEPGEPAAGREVEVIPSTYRRSRRARSRWSNRRQSSLPLLNSRISPTYRRVRSRPFPRPLSRSRRPKPRRSRHRRYQSRHSILRSPSR